MKSYEFIDKALFFPERGVLVIGDFHIGYEESLVESGILVPEQQVNEVVENLKKIIERINKKRQKLRKLFFLGILSICLDMNGKKNLISKKSLIS